MCMWMVLLWADARTRTIHPESPSLPTPTQMQGAAEPVEHPTEQQPEPPASMGAPAQVPSSSSTSEAPKTGDEVRNQGGGTVYTIIVCVCGCVNGFCVVVSPVGFIHGSPARNDLSPLG